MQACIHIISFYICLGKNKLFSLKILIVTVSITKNNYSLENLCHGFFSVSSLEWQCSCQHLKLQ